MQRARANTQTVLKQLCEILKERCVSYEAAAWYLLGHWHIYHRDLSVSRVGLGQAITGRAAFGNDSSDFDSLAALEGAEGKALPVTEGLHFQEKQAEINKVKLQSR